MCFIIYVNSWYESSRHHSDYGRIMTLDCPTCKFSVKVWKEH
jgi:hypothetical protein